MLVPIIQIDNFIVQVETDHFGTNNREVACLCSDQVPLKQLEVWTICTYVHEFTYIRMFHLRLHLCQLSCDLSQLLLGSALGLNLILEL